MTRMYEETGVFDDFICGTYFEAIHQGALLLQRLAFCAHDLPYS